MSRIPYFVAFAGENAIEHSNRNFGKACRIHKRFRIKWSCERELKPIVVFTSLNYEINARLYINYRFCIIIIKPIIFVIGSIKH